MQQQHIYRYRYILINSSGEKQTMISPIYTNPYKMSIALLQSYRFLEQRLIGDLALVRRQTTEFLLDLLKFRLAIGDARELINKICTEPDFPGRVTYSFQLFEFTPEAGSVPLRAAVMEVMVNHAPGYSHKCLVTEITPAIQQTHFTPVEYKFINRYLRTMPKFPSA